MKCNIGPGKKRLFSRIAALAALVGFVVPGAAASGGPAVRSRYLSLPAFNVAGTDVRLLHRALLYRHKDADGFV